MRGAGCALAVIAGIVGIVGIVGVGYVLYRTAPYELTPGMTVAEVARRCPGTYGATRAPIMFPDARRSPPATLARFTGFILFTSPGRAEARWRVWRGRIINVLGVPRTELHREPMIGETLGECLARLPTPVVARLVPAVAEDFMLELPRDLAKVVSLTGELSGGTVTTRRNSGWRLTVREGRIVSVDSVAKID